VILVSDLKINEIMKALKPFSMEEEANAAVAILLKPTDEGLKILLVKRIENVRDPWSGQIALPGGKRDRKDRNLKETVLREILEETGINLLDRCRFLGVTEAVRSQLNPELKILPFVVLLEHEPKIRLNMNELERCYWIPIKDLVKNECTVKFGFEAHPAFVIGDIKIGGLTFRILKKFFHALNID